VARSRCRSWPRWASQHLENAGDLAAHRRFRTRGGRCRNVLRSPCRASRGKTVDDAAGGERNVEHGWPAPGRRAADRISLAEPAVVRWP
jgi:hypothetical protein